MKSLKSQLTHSLCRCDPEHQKQRFTNLTKRDEVHALAAFEDLSDGSVDGQTQIDNYFSLMRSKYGCVLTLGLQSSVLLLLQTMGS